MSAIGGITLWVSKIEVDVVPTTTFLTERQHLLNHALLCLVLELEL